MKRPHVAIAFVFLAVELCAQVQIQNIGSAPLPVGSGARALGQGGAFTAVADDATAASWNPAGLVQLEKPELSAVGLYYPMRFDFDSAYRTAGLEGELTHRIDLNYLSAVYPFELFDRNIVVSLNYKQIYDLNLDLSFSQYFDTPIAPGLTFQQWQRIDFKQRGGVAAISPALAFQITPKCSFGFALNFYQDEYLADNAWTKTIRLSQSGDIAGTPFISSTFLHEDYSNFEGFNATIGILLNLYEKEEKKFAIGARLDTPYTASVTRDRRVNTFMGLGSGGGGNTFYAFMPTHERIKIDYPTSVTLGLAYQASDAFTASMDVQHTAYSNFFLTDERGMRTRPIAGAPADADIRDTYEVRMGCEYLIFREKSIIPLRAGAFWQQKPSIGTPQDFIGFSVGSGVILDDWLFDVAYQLKFGNNLDGADIGIPNIHYDSYEHLVLFSVIKHF